MRNKVNIYQNELVNTIFNPRNGRKAGEVGIEIEVEGKNIPTQDDLTTWWTVKQDGSLRGESAEYVHSDPVTRAHVSASLHYLAQAFTDKGSTVDMSYRTSVHVHINQQTLTMKQLLIEMILYYMYEEVLTDFCGSDRVGNKFCLRARDAEDVISRIYNSYRNNDYGAMNEEHIKYAAMNINALRRFGSLEFRAMRGTIDPNLITTWVFLLLRLKDAATDTKLFPDPASVAGLFSQLGVEAFTAAIFQDHAEIISGSEGWQKKVFNGMRMAQELAYVSKWMTPEELAEHLTNSPEKKKKGGKSTPWGIVPNNGNIILDDIVRMDQNINPAGVRRVGNWGDIVEAPPLRVQPQFEEDR